MTDAAWLRGDWMQTLSGKRYYPMDPRPEDIDAEDIAHALGMLCRYGGHVREFYSVAEHCVLMSYAVPDEDALHALLHDATEAYVVDVPRPVKRYLTNYKDIENRVWGAISSRFGVSSVLPASVLAADNRILLNEKAALLPDSEAVWPGFEKLKPLDISIRAWSPARARLEYIIRLHELLDAKDEREHRELGGEG